MAVASELGAGPMAASRTSPSRGAWLFSWPFLVGVWVYLYSLYQGKELLIDGDTYWHIATGQWIWHHSAVPTTDPFSHATYGVAWTAHEWLSDVILAAAHQIGGWTLVLAVTALAFAATIALLTRALLKWLEPIYALLFAILAVSLTIGHLLARPHILAMPLMMMWTIELVRAREDNRSPALWLLPVMTLWANLHGGFTLGILLTCPFALEALVKSAREQRVATAKSWGLFLGLSVISGLITPHGVQGILYTWQLMFEHSYALQRVGEWRSPDFHTFSSLELWLLSGLALVMHQGLRLPAMRLVLVLGLLHLALKHVRSIELLGLLLPLFIAEPFAMQWREAKSSKRQLESADRFFHRLAQPAGKGAMLIGLLIVLAAPLWNARVRPVELPESVAPVLAIKAVQEAGIKGPVLNSYISGGYLIYLGIPVFIDGRSDMHGDEFLKEYLEALELRRSDALEKLLDKYHIAWTLLEPETPAVALLDHLPEWRRLYAGKTAVVHVRATQKAAPPDTQDNPARIEVNHGTK
jgi:hypothetical protein